MIVKKIYQTLCVLFGVVAIWQAITIASGIMTLAQDDRLFKPSQMGNNISFFAIKLLLFGVCLLLSRWFSKLSKRTYENVNVARESLIPDFKTMIHFDSNSDGSEILVKQLRHKVVIIRALVVFFLVFLYIMQWTSTRNRISSLEMEVIRLQSELDDAKAEISSAQSDISDLRTLADF